MYFVGQRKIRPAQQSWAYNITVPVSVFVSQNTEYRLSSQTFPSDCLYISIHKFYYDFIQVYCIYTVVPWSYATPQLPYFLV